MELSKTHSAALNKARIVGGSPKVYLSTEELIFLLYLVCVDLDVTVPDQLKCVQDTPWANHAFFDIPIGEVMCDLAPSEASLDSVLADALGRLINMDGDIFTYFQALISLHAQRRKYRAILDHQPVPELETIIPRGLLEMGGLPPDLLAAWLVWRKFIYDIDNRAAQTTGYLFEPILTLALGGASFSAQKSPVLREGKGRGRQVDCMLGQDAYEFKMRVTIAASGQGRFAEELKFAEDCYLSGFRPVLLVLDPTSSSRLEELSKEYRDYGGSAFVGDDAWLHLGERAGAVMSVFLERYVRVPLAQIDDAFEMLLPLALDYDGTANEIHVTIGASRSRLR
ncbi:MAG: restriction endonuclease [Anaerolineae bacterium]|nr:restriction endonuclease [Anaerolineae bacterium]